MAVTQKCQYALRALFELAKREGTGVVRSADIAQAQAIPRRFLEVILNQLRQGGFVDSLRGKEGGFFLLRPSGEVTVGDVIRFMDGPIAPVDCRSGKLGQPCPLKGQCVFLSVWDEAGQAMEAVYDARTLRDLVEMEREATLAAIDFSI